MSDEDFLGLALKRIEFLKSETRRLTDADIDQATKRRSLQYVWEELADLACRVEMVKAIRRMARASEPNLIPFVP